MTLSRALLAAPFALLFWLWGRLAWVYPELPARIPSHFGASGRADGWMSPQAFVLFNAVVPALVLAVLLGCGLLVGRLPARWINVPHRDYWLAPERIAATRRKILANLAAIAALTLALLLGIAEISIHLARTGGGRLPALFFWLLGLFLAGTLGSAVALLLAFRRPGAPD